MFIAEKCKGVCVYKKGAYETPEVDTRCTRCGYPKDSFGEWDLSLSSKKEQGVISTSMCVDTKPSKKLEYKGHWILVDGKISDSDFEELKVKINAR